MIIEITLELEFEGITHNPAENPCGFYPGINRQIDWKSCKILLGENKIDCPDAITDYFEKEIENAYKEKFF